MENVRTGFDGEVEAIGVVRIIDWFIFHFRMNGAKRREGASCQRCVEMYKTEALQAAG